MYCRFCGKQIVDDSIFCNYCGEKQIADSTPKTREDLIIEAAKDCIKKHLKSPFSVRFVNVEWKDTDSYGRVYVLAELDSQNGFGAMIRGKFHVVLQQVYEDGTYDAFDAESVYQAGFITTENVVKDVNKWNKKPKNKTY